MLSGTTLTAHVSAVPVEYEGGFIAVPTTGFLQTNANNFLFDADSLGQIADDFTLFDFGNVVRFGESFVTLDSAGDVDSDAASSIASPTIGPSVYDFDLSDSLELQPLLPKTGDSLTLNDDAKIPADNILDKPANDSPGLQGPISKLLVIEDPIQILSSQHKANRTDQQEGGALEVAVAVHTTQHAYVTQLSAVIASNLDRDGMLPTSKPTRVQPIVAELARAVAFETVALREAVPTDEAAKITKDPLIEPTQAVPTTPEPISAQLRITPVRRSSTGETANDEIATYISEAYPRGETTSPSLAERIENEQQAALDTTFAEWPVLATVIAGYLLIERSSPQAAETVQIPPRRQRPRQGQTPGK